MDITSTNLAAAIIDQKVAGAFRGRTYAFTAVMLDQGGWGLGVAVKNEDGYNPIEGQKFETEKEARRFADGLNEHIGLGPREAAIVVASTMIGRHS